jgi:hypothetical protein
VSGTSTAADGARTAVVLGGFAAAWFAWAGAEAPEPLAMLVGVGSGIALAVALVAAHLAYRTRGAPSAVATDPAAHRRYGAVIAVETLLCAAGAALLTYAITKLPAATRSTARAAP